MRNRSLFWPFFLIATGAVWLLIEMRTIPFENLWAVMYIWPFFLMAAGIGLILRSRWPLARMFVSGLLVLGMVGAIVFAPQFSWNKAPAWGYFTFGNWGNFNGAVRGSGVVVTENRKPADFTSVEINYPVELTIQQGSATSLTIEGEDTVLPQLATRVSGNTLYIENNQPDWTKRVNSTHPVKIQMTVKDLEGVDFPSAGSLSIGSFHANQLDISISGAGSIHLSDLTAQSLTINLSGAGNITAGGKVDSLNMDISGFGGFQGADLASQSAHVTISGAGNATVWAKSDLKVNISGTGSVKYYGSPSVTKNVSGLGSVTGLGIK
jgi:Putative auto-transporter adhesin, head GIN domain